MMPPRSRFKDSRRRTDRAARDGGEAAFLDLEEPVALLASLGGRAGADDARPSRSRSVVEAVVDVAAEDGVGAILRARLQKGAGAAEVVQRPVAPAAAAGRRVVRQHQLAPCGMGRIAQRAGQSVELLPPDAGAGKERA